LRSAASTPRVSAADSGRFSAWAYLERVSGLTAGLERTDVSCGSAEVVGFRRRVLLGNSHLRESRLVDVEGVMAAAT
jgi:hypothetical protein